MDMQNVKNLTIPEGDVKTIHDKDSRLLWGAVGYDTKYAGDTFQQTYSGKNLIPYPYASSSSSPRVSAGITFIDNGDGTITINGQNDGTGNSVYYLVGGGNPLTLPAGTYYANTSAMFSTGGTITMYDGSSYRGLSLNNPSITLTQETTFSSVYYQITRNNTLSLNNVKFYPIMSSTSGQTVDNWEPYVGGTASPNPDYPQDIDVVTGEQTVKVTGKNLTRVTGANGYNITPTLSNGEVNINGAMSAAGNVSMPMTTSLKANTTYILSVIGTGTVSGSGYKTIYFNYGESSKTVGVVSSNTTRTYSFTPTNDVSNVTLNFDLANGTAFTNYNVKIQIEKGSTPTTYEPYQGQFYTVDLGSIELCKIGTYQDYIYKSGDDWYVHKATGKVTLDGTQSIAISNWRASDTSVGWVYAYNEFNSATIAAGSVGAIVSDKLLAASFTSLFDKAQDYGVALYTNTDYGLAVRVKDPTLTTSSAVNTYLGSNPIDVYYSLATPTDTKITDSTLIGELEAIHEWMTRYGYQASVTGNLPMIIRQDALT